MQPDVSRADRRRADRSGPRREGPTSAGRAVRTPPTAVPANVAAYFGDSTAVLTVGAFVLLAGAFLWFLWGAIEARITWYLAVDQFGYLQFANDLLRGKIFHDWEPARIMGILP